MINNIFTMTYEKIVKKIENTCKKHIFVQEFGYGDVYEYLNSTSHKYPILYLTTDNIQVDIDDRMYTLNGTLYFVDRVQEDNKNTLYVQSQGLSVLTDIFSKLNNELNISNITCTPFTQKFTDLCGGAYASFTIEVDGGDLCKNTFK